MVEAPGIEPVAAVLQTGPGTILVAPPLVTSTARRCWGIPSRFDSTGTHYRGSTMMRQLRSNPIVNGADREEGMSIARAEAELTILKGEFERTRLRFAELQQRIAKIQNYIDVAREFESTEDALPDKRTRIPQGGIGAQAIRLAIEMVRERGQPIPTRELVDMMKDRGLDVGGNNPITTLSSYLSRAPELSADRSRGWSLTELPADDIKNAHDAETMDDAAE